MDNNQYLTWVEFYTELATKLLTYADDRKALIEKIRQIYASIHMKLPKLDNGEMLADIDPFTVFGLFNKGITEANRIAILNGFAKSFEVSAKTPVHFDGIPVLNPMNATFVWLSNDLVNGVHDIDNLWSLFTAALHFADERTSDNRDAFISAFDKVKDLKGNRWKLTMGLYWVRPLSYLNMDARNRWFLENPKNITEDCIKAIKGLSALPTGTAYLSICEMVTEALKSGVYPYINFPELSFYAWTASQMSGLAKVGDDGQPHAIKGAALADENIEQVRYWLYAPGGGAVKWDEFYHDGIMAIGWDYLGDLRAYASKSDIQKKMQEFENSEFSFKMSAHATWQFANEIKPGDVVFAKKGKYLVVGRGVVTSDYEFDETRGEYPHFRSVNWTHRGEWPYPADAAIKTLTDITPYTNNVEKLNAYFSDGPDVIEPPSIIDLPPYTKQDFLRDVYVDENAYDTLVSLLTRKKNLILQGAPGVGKTFAAKRLAYSMMGEKDPKRVMMIQFHQSYTYEDFIMGFRPTETGFELKKGAFYHFCKKAEVDSDNDYFFIIDEINRGNLSKIFGELFMLIESDKRGIGLQLLYADEVFSIPENVYIIGMMNTADRSLAMLDYALRRRFAFYELQPGFTSDGFRQYRKALASPLFNKLIERIEALNEEIAADESLGEHFCIGHSYFCGLTDVNDGILRHIVEFEIVPLLREYWFDEPQKVKSWAQTLRSVTQ